MAAKIHNIFREFSIDIKIPGQHTLTGAQRSAVTKAYADSSDRAIQFHCAVAEATNKALGAVYDSSGERVTDADPVEFPGVGLFQINKKGLASFGVNSSGHLFLTVNLVGQHDDLRYRLTWKDSAIPKALAEVAVAHDCGAGHRAITATLEFANAELAVLRKAVDARPNDAAARERKNGNRTPGLKRKHRRACAADVERVYA